MTHTKKNRYGEQAKHSIVNKPLPVLEVTNAKTPDILPFGKLKIGEQALSIEGRSFNSVLRYIRQHMEKHGGLFLAYEDKNEAGDVQSILVYRIDKNHAYASLAVTASTDDGKRNSTPRLRPIEPVAAPVAVVAKPAAPVAVTAPTKGSKRNNREPVVVVDEVYTKKPVAVVAPAPVAQRGYPEKVNAEVVLQMYESGVTTDAIASKYGISASYVYTLTSNARKARREQAASV